MGPLPAAWSPDVYTAPTATSLSSLPLAQGNGSGDTTGQATTPAVLSMDLGGGLGSRA